MPLNEAYEFLVWIYFKLTPYIDAKGIAQNLRLANERMKDYLANYKRI